MLNFQIKYMFHFQKKNLNNFIVVFYFSNSETRLHLRKIFCLWLFLFFYLKLCLRNFTQIILENIFNFSPTRVSAATEFTTSDL